MSENQQGNNQDRRIVRQEISASFSGPLPPPNILEHYDRIIPGAANRILIMAEEQSKHRQKLETKVIDSDILNSKLGLVFGLVVGLGGLGVSAFVVERGYVWEGASFGFLTLASLVGTFVYGSQQRRKERKEKEG